MMAIGKTCGTAAISFLLCDASYSKKGLFYRDGKEPKHQRKLAMSEQFIDLSIAYPPGACDSYPTTIFVETLRSHYVTNT